MIQRIQSIFLLFAAALILSLFKVPMAMSDMSANPFFQDRLLTSGDHVALIVLSVLGGGLALLAIFMFKNRTLQMRLGYLGIISSLFLALIAFWLVYSNADALQDVKVEDQVGMYFPLGAIILFFLANRFIKKDENTVRSMDRLR